MSRVIRPKLTKPLPTLPIGTRVRVASGAEGEVVIVRRRKLARRYGIALVRGSWPTYYRHDELQVIG